MDSAQDDRALPRPGCPIRRSPDQSLLSGSPKLIAASHVLLRLLAPRHPPCALSSLTMFATGRPELPGCPDAIAWVSYHALALSDGLPVQLVKDRLAGSGNVSETAMDRHPDPRCGPLVGPQRASGVRIGGADGDRTHDLRLAKPALSQLSYSPEGHGGRTVGGQARSASVKRPKPTLSGPVPVTRRKGGSCLDTSSSCLPKGSIRWPSMKIKKPCRPPSGAGGPR